MRLRDADAFPCTLLLLLCAATTPAAAQLREPSANPNRPSFGLEHRAAVRGSFGAELPLLAPLPPTHSGLAITLSPLFELHEPQDSSQFLPSQYWRARLPLELAYTHALTTPTTRLRVALALEHESDHETAHPYSRPGFLTLNDVALRAGLALGELIVFRATAEAALYLVSCTTLAATCRNFDGSSGAGAALDLGVTFPRARLLAFHPFAALHGSLLFGHELLQDERRAALHLGLSRRLGPGQLQLFALAYAGNDLGRARARTLTALGAGLQLLLDLWPPAPPAPPASATPKTPSAPPPPTP